MDTPIDFASPQLIGDYPADSAPTSIRRLRLALEPPPSSRDQQALCTHTYGLERHLDLPPPTQRKRSATANVSAVVVAPHHRQMTPMPSVGHQVVHPTRNQDLGATRLTHRCREVCSTLHRVVRDRHLRSPFYATPLAVLADQFLLLRKSTHIDWLPLILERLAAFVDMCKLRRPDQDAGGYLYQASCGSLCNR